MRDEAHTRLAKNRRAACAFTAADARLDRADARTLAASDTARRPSLPMSQRTRLRVRDAHCRRVGREYESGSLYPVDLTSCLADVTGARTHRLERDVKHEPR